jgi:hypothetical protein
MSTWIIRGIESGGKALYRGAKWSERAARRERGVQVIFSSDDEIC